MRVLVTGASGMLGRTLTRTLSTTHQVIGVSRSGNHGSRVCDLTDEEQIERVFASSAPELVIHTAAYSDVDGCERDPKLAHESNALTTKYLARACGSVRAALVYVSTDYVFSGKKNSLYLETDTPCPVQVYGMTKLEGEFFARTAPASAIVRTSWLFGAGNPKNFVNALAERLRSEKTVKVLADQEDSPTFVKDLSLALQKIGDHVASFVKKNLKKETHELFHVCNKGVTTRFEMTQQIGEFLGLKDIEIQRLAAMPAENRPALRPRFAAMSCAHYENFFKINLRSWQESLEEYLSEFKLANN